MIHEACDAEVRDAATEAQQVVADARAAFVAARLAAAKELAAGEDYGGALAKLVTRYVALEGLAQLTVGTVASGFDDVEVTSNDFCCQMVHDRVYSSTIQRTLLLSYSFPRSPRPIHNIHSAA